MILVEASSGGSAPSLRQRLAARGAEPPPDSEQGKVRIALDESLDACIHHLTNEHTLTEKVHLVQCWLAPTLRI